MADEAVIAEQTNLTKEQKIGFILLLIFAILGIILGVLQIRNTLYGPFALSNKVPGSIKDEVNDITALRYRDTDGDGLNDYDELYVYGTSPYLYDTFGYGMSDKQVVDKNLPRCPNAGKNCVTAETPLVTTKPAQPPTTTVPSEADFNQVLNNPAELRSMLLQSGIKKSVLDKVSDADLMNLVAEVIASSTASTIPH